MSWGACREQLLGISPTGCDKLGKMGWSSPPALSFHCAGTEQRKPNYITFRRTRQFLGAGTAAWLWVRERPKSWR
ncbi:MAG: hypothetical protein KME26_08305 [Oscillatoria princeps RMCB-10]|nr:hypothetical protein [Oscillatoria princeps RMCB-10]